jgi:hypothetical protein
VHSQYTIHNTQYTIPLLKDNNKFVSLEHSNILFTFLATSFGRQTIIRPPTPTHTHTQLKARYPQCTLHAVHITLVHITRSAHYTQSTLPAVHITRSAHYPQCTLHAVHITRSAHYPQCTLPAVHITRSAHYTQCCMPSHKNLHKCQIIF